MAAGPAIRPALESDFPLITAIYAAAVRSGAASYELEPPSEAEMKQRWHSVYVAPDAQGHGLGRALLSALIKECEALGFRQMIAVIGGGTEHPASVGLHTTLGFRKVGIVEGSGFKHGRWLDALLMQRALGPGKTTLPADAAI